ncbi:MAG: hypothetical protein OEU32_17785 [Acidimicrobiia bacterium]|nr:hypothetical protein [Acidimicrobiia bacterium]
MRRGLGIVAAVVALAAIGVAGFVFIDRFGGDQDEPSVTTESEVTTVQIVRTDLVEQDTLEGTVRYRDPGTLIASGAGTITALPAAGTLLARGDAAYELDGAPVTLMFGDRPPWRPIEDGVSDGPDVGQLERNLWVLGFDDDFAMALDDEVDDATIGAIERWQESLGREDVSVVLPSEIVIAPRPVRVGQRLVDTGAVIVPGTRLYETSATSHEVIVLLDADRQDLLTTGDDVTIVLPDDTETPGVVREVGKVVVTVGQGPEARRAVEVLVDLVVEGAAGQLDEAPVDVEVVTSRAEDVVAVPVEALLALAEGGYAVEVSEAGATRLVAVEIGTFADGLVAVSGDIAPGDLVIVAG